MRYPTSRRHYEPKPCATAARRRTRRAEKRADEQAWRRDLATGLL